MSRRQVTHIAFGGPRLAGRSRNSGIDLHLKNQEERERSVYGLDAIDGPLASPQMPPISGEFYQQRGYVRQRLLENREKFADETFVNDEETDETEEAVSEEPTA